MTKQDQNLMWTLIKRPCLEGTNSGISDEDPPAEPRNGIVGTSLNIFRSAKTPGVMNCPVKAGCKHHCSKHLNRLTLKCKEMAQLQLEDKLLFKATVQAYPQVAIKRTCTFEK
jgi:hypothetical protein